MGNYICKFQLKYVLIYSKRLSVHLKEDFNYISKTIIMKKIIMNLHKKMLSQKSNPTFN